MAIDSQDIVKDGAYYVNRSSIKESIAIALRRRYTSCVVCAFCIVICFITPKLTIFSLLIAFFAYRTYRNKPLEAPLYFHHSTKIIDPRHIDTNGKACLADGQFYIGQCHATGMPVFDMFDTLLRHVFVAGVTGAGKTEQLVSMLTNYLIFGSGGIYSDAKGSAEFYHMLFTIMRKLGREDDLQLLNYNTLDEFDDSIGSFVRITNTCSPLNSASTEANIQILLSMIDDGEGGGGGNAVFKQASETLIKVVLDCLADLKRKRIAAISPSLIRDHIDYDGCSQLVFNPNISEQLRYNVLSFFKTRAGFESDKDFKEQDDQTKQQFGYATAYLARPLQLLADSYSGIYRFGRGEVNMVDIVLNNRVLVVILPSMTKSASELKQIAKLNFIQMQGALSLGLGVEVDGDTSVLSESLVTNCSVPNMFILDEFKYQMVKNYAITVAQARSMGTTMVISSQDWSGIDDRGDPEAGQLWSNTRNKFIMASEMDAHTSKVLDLIIPDVNVLRQSGMSRSYDGKLYNDDRKNIERVKLLTQKDFRALGKGQGYLFQQDKIIRINSFYHGINKKKFVQRVALWDGVEPNYEPKGNPLYHILKSTVAWQIGKVFVFARNFNYSDLVASLLPRREKLVSLRNHTYNNPKFTATGLDSGLAQLIAYDSATNLNVAIERTKMLKDTPLANDNAFDTAPSIDTSSPVAPQDGYTVSPSLSKIIGGGVTTNSEEPKDNNNANLASDNRNPLSDLLTNMDQIKSTETSASVPIESMASVTNIDDLIGKAMRGEIPTVDFTLPDTPSTNLIEFDTETDPTTLESLLDETDSELYTASSVLTKESTDVIRRNTIEVEMLLGISQKSAEKSADDLLNRVENATTYANKPLAKKSDLSEFYNTLEQFKRKADRGES